MSALRNLAIDWYRRVFGAPGGSDIREKGLDTVLDGNTAVALSEAAISGHAVLGGAYPAADADAIWRAEIERGSGNLFGEALAAQSATGPRGIVAAATGLAMAGRRATAFLSGPDVAAAQDLLVAAAGRHAPLVLHLATRASAAHGATFGSGHDSVHLSGDSGFFMLFASNVQEAIDFTYIGRRVAEETLVPGLVVMDGEQTALAAQDARLLAPAQASRLLGPAAEHIDAPTPAQQLLFGETRRRVPTWHDLDEPLLSGAVFEADGFALGASARRPYFDAFVGESLSAAFDALAAVTGRQHGTVSTYQLKDAQTVLIAQGAAIETARAAADHLRRQHKRRVGVLGIHALRPFPGAAIAAALAGCNECFILERVDTPLSGDPPLTREVRAAVGDARVTCSPAVYGVGGLPLRVVDLVELVVQGAAAGPRFLGLRFDDTSGEPPKRAVLLDALRRAYPEAAGLGVRAAPVREELREREFLAIEIRHDNGVEERGIAGAAGAVLHELEGGHVRSRPAMASGRWAQPSSDRLVHGQAAMHDPGDGLPADIIVDAKTGNVQHVAVDSRTYEVADAAAEEDPGARAEMLLGGLFAVLLERGLLDHKPRQVVGARRTLLATLDTAERERRLEAFQAGLENTAETGQAAPSDAALVVPDDEVPAAVRHLGRDDDHVASLPRFRDQLGALWGDDVAGRLTADPFLATGTMPPLSSTFGNFSAARSTWPAFDPLLCTGCGRCWTSCPDSAIGVVAATPAALIDEGIRRCGADAVRQVASKLAARITANGKAADAPATTFGPMLEEAYAWLGEKMPLPEDRRQAISAGVSSIADELGRLPVAVTEPFFKKPEAQKKESGELLSLAVNPDACKACGLCVASCEPMALTLVDQDAGLLEEARAAWSAWSATPDTAHATIERVADDPDVGAMAALLLSRFCQFAMAGGDTAEAGSGEKIAVRLLLAATEYHRQPLLQRFARSLSETGDAVTALLRETLSTTLAVDDLDAIMARLQSTDSPRVDLRTLAGDSGASDRTLDAAALQRLIELSKSLSEAHERLVRGDHGLGRARYGLAVAGGSVASWAGAFPHNPFQAPAVIDMSGDAAQLAAGLIEGHLHGATDLARLLRLARLEIDQPDGADWQRAALGKLRWQDLGDEEYELCAPLVLLGSDEMLAAAGLGQLMWLLNSRLPVKVLVMQSLDFGLSGNGADGSAPVNDPRSSLALLALAQRNAYVAQVSIAEPAHLCDAFLEALRYDGPALLQVYAPSPARHGFASDQSIRQAALATHGRVLPLYRYHPGREGVFGMRLTLDGNPQPAEPLAAADESGRVVTPADWALGQARFAHAFRPLGSDAQGPVPLAEWLQMNKSERARKTPFLGVGDDEQQRHAIAAPMLEMSVRCMETWQTLQELAGLVTPFTERLEQSIREAVAAEHQAELDAQKRAADAEIQAIRERTEAEIAEKIRTRLKQLAARRPGGST